MAGPSLPPPPASSFPSAPQSIFLTGGTGLVGAEVLRKLLAAGHRVVAASRQPMSEAENSDLSWIRADLSADGEWSNWIDGTDAVIHLAGEPIAAGRWTASRKARLRDSRIESTRRIVEAIGLANRPPAVLICASACGYYGPRGSEELDEQSPPGHDFLARLCVDWETAALGAAESGRTRVVLLRFGAVLSREAGVLARLRPLFRVGLGGPLGDPEAYFPWIHVADAAGLVEWTHREGNLHSGAINAVAPENVRMVEWATTLGRVLGRRSGLAVPQILLGAMLGEIAQALIPGQRVVPRMALQGGYCFSYPNLAEALRSLLSESG